MKISLLTGLRAGLATALLLSTVAGTSQAQTCPTVASCTPLGASSPQAVFFGEGIFNVVLGSISNATPGNADGYRDYSCVASVGQASLLLGQTYTLTVTTNPNRNENLRAWIDYNNDGAFNGANEALPTTPAGRTHTIRFTPPAGAVTGTPLRLRLSADDVTSPIPTPCSRPVYSQVEDYGVVLSVNSNPPVAAFTTDGTYTCSGCVQFTDASQNVPTSWSWNFGDGSPAVTTQNPRYCYTNAGIYQVTLTATNAAGTSTSTATTITYNPVVPATACVPAVGSPLGSYGVVRFQLNTIDNRSAAAGVGAGYQDFSCAQRTSLTVGVNYPLTLTLASAATANQDTRVYVDLNNDGTFAASEKLFEALTTATPATPTFSLPGSTTLNQPLRLRVVTDAGGSNPLPCTLQSGQAEDYTIVALPNTQPPVVDFTSDYVPGGCVNPIQFTDRSSGAPTSWLWDFGDGQTSTLQNPSHQYAASGPYTVSLTVTNANGPSTLTRPAYVSVSVPCLVYCNSNGIGAGGGPGGPPPSQAWITNVGVSAPNQAPGGPTYTAFANASGNSATAPIGYGDYTAQVVPLRQGQAHVMTVVSNLIFSHRTIAWIDYNADGVFDNTPGNPERVIVSPNNPPQGTTYTQSFTVPTGLTATRTRMRVHVSINNNPVNPCGVNIQNAEVEDYTVELLQPLGTRATAALPGLRVYPNPTPGALALVLDDARDAGAYEARVETLLGATVLRGALRLAPSAEARLDLGTLAPGVYVLRLTDAAGRTALRRVVRE